MLGEAREDGWMGGEAPEPLRSTTSLYVVVANPDELHTRAVAAGADVVRALEDMDYGSREFSVRDLEGNLLVVPGAVRPVRRLNPGGRARYSGGMPR